MIAFIILGSFAIGALCGGIVIHGVYSTRIVILHDDKPADPVQHLRRAGLL